MVGPDPHSLAPLAVICSWGELRIGYIPVRLDSSTHSSCYTILQVLHSSRRVRSLLLLLRVQAHSAFSVSVSGVNDNEMRTTCAGLRVNLRCSVLRARVARRRPGTLGRSGRRHLVETLNFVEKGTKMEGEGIDNYESWSKERRSYRKRMAMRPRSR